MDTMADLADATQRLDMDMEEIAGTGPLVALHRDRRRRREADATLSDGAKR